MDQPLPVICDLCRADGLVGAAPFADLADLLSFTPVPRRPHANGWSPEMQRGFIAALVATGSPRPRRARHRQARLRCRAIAPRPAARERLRIEAEQDAADRFDELAEARDRIRARLTNARRLLLKLIAPDPAKRAAWEALVGPVDWARAERGAAQDDEPLLRLASRHRRSERA